MLGSAFINQGSLKISVTSKALQELFSGQGFGKGPRQSSPPSLSSLPQTFQEFQCPISLASLCSCCQASKAHPRFLFQMSDGGKAGK